MLHKVKQKIRWTDRQCVLKQHSIEVHAQGLMGKTVLNTTSDENATLFTLTCAYYFILNDAVLQ